MQQIPTLDDDDPMVANKYRMCFVPDDGWSFVGSDYKSQELVVIAALSQDPVWLESLEKGWDLHSVCSALVFGKEWDNGALPGCKYVAIKDKCKCPAHKRMRNSIKPISFGLAYGMSEFKLAATLQIGVPEAKALIRRYFDTFPKIENKLKALGAYAVRNGHIMTCDPYRRKRYYPFWERAKEHINYHLEGIEYNTILGSIERTGKNTPIQGSSADMVKLAMVMVFKYIVSRGLQHKVKLVLQVHDEIVTMARNDYAQEWAEQLNTLMEQAAKVIIPSGLLKADTSIMDRWQK